MEEGGGRYGGDTGEPKLHEVGEDIQLGPRVKSMKRR